MRRFLVVLVAVAVLVPTRAYAQLSWDAPSLVEPYAPQGLSLMVLNPDPGNHLSALAHWRHDSASLGLGYRAGLGKDPSGDLAVMAGVDVSGILARSVERSDVQVLWWTGLGGSLGNNLMASVPMGIVAGWHGIGAENILAPYVGGHLALDLATRQGDVVSLHGSLDLGVDLTLTSGFVVRVGAAVGGRDAFALGLRVPGVHLSL